MARFSDRVAIVTGGASGIGEATVRQLHREGACVVVGDVDEEKLEQLEAELGDRLAGVRCDVRVEGDVEHLVDATIDRFGHLDVAFNVAGGGRNRPIHETDEDAWRYTIDVSLTGVFFALKHEARQMIDQRFGGAIVNVASICAQIPVFGGAAYCCAKAGVEMLTKVAALELGAHQIRVNAVLPGFTATPAVERAITTLGNAYIAQTPLARIAEPEDIASVLLFLGSDEARHVSGVSMLVDGAFATAGHFDLRPYARREKADPALEGTGPS